MKLTYPACFYKDDNSDAYAVVVPDLPGCVSGGDTLEEAILMGIDAASGWVLDELEDGKTPPKASAMESIKPDQGGFVSLLLLDMTSYAEKFGKKTVTKNFTIPAFLDTFAESQHINYSHLVQESLSERHRQLHC
ncbi:MAG: type II toxin-antitoxin system HicB family antitoxin [Holophagaceae bacterium]|nr:type II toxin-antitoxin system HicB family antitoxin [Holophagaceae bacterium]